MAHFYETKSESGMKFGEIVLSIEDKESLQNGTGKGWSKNIINKIIWGEREHFYDKE